MRFIHASDLHIDSQLAGLEKLEEAPVEEIRRAPREAFQKLVRLAHEEQADFVVLAGDIFDQEWKDVRTGRFFNSQLQELNPIPVFIAKGNHDAETEILKQLKLPQNTYAFSAQHAETKTLPDIGVAIHGQSYKTRAVVADLSAGYPAPIEGYTNIGVLHTALGGHPPHENYAPCTVAGLTSRGYDYWALGHVHNRIIVGTDPLIIFPGNIQGRNIRETGPKGCMVVDNAAGVLTTTFHALDVVRWFDESVDVSNAATAYDAIDIAVKRIHGLRSENENNYICVRMRFKGRTSAHRMLELDASLFENDLRSQVLPMDVWLVDLRLETTPAAGVAKLREQDDVQGSLFRAIDAMRGDLSNDALRKVVQPLKERLPPEVVRTYGTRLDDPEVVKESLDVAERILLAQLDL